MPGTIYMREYMKEYRKTEKWKEYHRVHMQKWRKKNGTTKDALRSRIFWKIKQGELVKMPCEMCGELEVEAHHDDYRSVFKINWLCIRHHRERDVEMGKRKS